MPLNKDDQKFIQTIVQDSEKRLDKKIDVTKNEIITTISREVSDLADINRAVITKIEEMDYRLRIVERKLGLSVR